MAAAVEEKKQEREVLPPSVKPIHYFVSYSSINLTDAFTFDAQVTIDLSVVASTDSISLNSNDLKWDGKCVTLKQKGANCTVKAVDFDAKTEQAKISLDKKLAVGDAQLVIKFSGNINDKMKGFYRSKYKLSDGKDAFCGVTQFESTDARRAFPCWDEPACKATFELEMTYPKELTCLSNTEPIAAPTVSGNSATVRFEKTPKMSTYLLAWAVGEFEYVEGKTKQNGIRVRVYTTMGNKSKGEFALQVGCDCLDFYEKYFGIPYPLTKCDMMAVPDFAAGAMENWGLITYREIALLCDKDKASLKQRQYIAIVVCHELAHQWFGNLVTMDWWSQLWLNEGFACFMEYLSSAALFPDWKMWNLFITSEYSRAYELDGMLSSHAIEVNVNTAQEAEEVFDAISYCKGACVIRMLQSYLGPKTFETALHKYLTKFQYSNAVTTDLWAALAKESGKNVADIMSTWTAKQGFPLITASMNKDGSLTLKQKRYLSSSANSDQKDDEAVWSVPISVRVAGSNDMHAILFNKKEQVFTSKDIKGLDAKKWVHLNANSTGFYVVEYDNNMFGMLAQALSANDQCLSEVDRLCLVRDAKALSSNGTQGATKQLLDLFNACQNENSYPLWDVLISSASDICHLIDGDKNVLPQFNTCMQNVLGPQYKKLGWTKTDKEDETTSGLLRPLILGAMTKYGNEDAIAQGLKLFEEFIGGNTDACDPALKSTVFGIGMKYGTVKDFENLKAFYVKAEDPADKTWSLRALGLTRNEKCISELLNWILTDDKEVRSQDKVFPFRTVAHTLAGRDIAWQFLQDKWDAWFEKFNGGFLVQHLAKIPSGFVSKAKADEVEKFFAAKKDIDACKRSMKQCVETIREATEWKERAWTDIVDWCKENGKETAKA